MSYDDWKTTEPSRRDDYPPQPEAAVEAEAPTLKPTMPYICGVCGASKGATTHYVDALGNIHHPRQEDLKAPQVEAEAPRGDPTEHYDFEFLANRIDNPQTLEDWRDRCQFLEREMANYRRNAAHRAEQLAKEMLEANSAPSNIEQEAREWFAAQAPEDYECGNGYYEFRLDKLMQFIVGFARHMLSKEK